MKNSTHSLQAIAVALLALFVIAPIARADVKESADVVKGTAKAGKADENGVRAVTITLAIDKPYHIYANPVLNELLEGAMTVVKFADDVKVVKIDYPKGEVHDLEGFGKYGVYEGTVTIKAKVKPKDASAPLNVSVKLQACTDKNCLIGGIIKLTAK